MSADHELTIAEAHGLAQEYIGTSAPLTRLGWGVSGFVFQAPSGQSVLKVHKARIGFENEVSAYRLLRIAKLYRLHGLTIPRMLHSRLDLKIVEMEFVSPPFLLDFAGVLFESPDFSDDVLANWHADIQMRFGIDNQWIAFAVYESLQKYGMYYVDLRPTNLNPKGLDGIIERTDPEDEPY